MLSELFIENLTLVESLHLDLKKGFICVTGETGAGKSALIHSLSLLAGYKAEKDRIRAGSSKLKAEGHFELKNKEDYEDWFIQNDIEYDPFCVLSREVSLNGSSKARVNGTIVPLNAFQELGSRLVQLHGQSEQVRLKDIKYHLLWLDQYALSETQLKPYQLAFAELSKMDKKIAKLKSDFQNKDQQSEFLKFQLKELQNSSLVLGEEEKITEELETLENSAELLELKNQVSDIIEGGKDNLFSKLNQLENTVAKLQDIKSDFKGWVDKIDTINAELENLNNAIQKIDVPEDISLTKIDKMNHRLSHLQKLQRKYKTDIAGLIALEAERINDLELIENFNVLLKEHLRDKAKLTETVNLLGSQLSEYRKKFALELDSKINELLQNLGMAGAKFRTDFSPLSEATSNGIDRVEFFITPNAGEGEKALKSTLSGGELSRIMLSLKSVLADKDEIPVLVFDEVDSGISGEVAHRISDCLADLGKYHQVFSITHLHQVAARADNHLVVVKTTKEDRTVSTIKWIEDEARVDELSRMLGDPNSKQIREHAIALLEKR